MKPTQGAGPTDEVHEEAPGRLPGLLPIGRQLAGLRVGQGCDIHALVPGRRLRIGGVEVAHARGALGHSDADVLMHAVTDALLGAAGLGDIGTHFPDTDAQWHGADSAAMLAEVARRLGAAGWVVINIDSTVCAQAPRLAAHVGQMAARIAQAVGIDQQQVNVKAKTGERLGTIGRGEAISAHAVALLVATAPP